ncbi:MAG: metallophosphoesterase family protein [Brevundimonas sp.]|uniref:metallophosphoesterase family protein n=1 Tax=Brevundimonas sp. TaxID=1871086 RepID=UPI002488E4B9|nr:metallophosphoesterase family protein [Brevundimonas sp.]MDI1325527.1 metallophosphoesterase family protein [Brevundimonas sp.]
MISRLFKRKLQAQAPRMPVVPKGVVTWAVGDIHGRLDLLEPLVDSMIADRAASPSEHMVVIFLGDYIDRGPHSRRVIRYLCNLPEDLGIEWKFLKGNHEEAMLDFLRDPATGSTWCEYGGDATLASYGLRLPQMKHKPQAWAHLSADLDHKLAPVERAFLEGLELSLAVGDYFFAHAGARPGIALSEQTERDLMWIRGSFLESEIEFEKVVVHGHTPAPAVQADRRRIGIDTKAYETGVLTALRLSGADRRIVQCVDGTVRDSTPVFSASA